MVVFRVLKVNDRHFLFLRPAAGALDGNGDTVPYKGVFFLVDMNQGGGGKVLLHLLLGFVQLGRGEPRVQPLEGLPKIPGKQNLMAACPAKGAVFPQLFGVIGKGHLPAQFPLQQVPGAFLDKDIFGVVAAHKVTILVYNLIVHIRSHVLLLILNRKIIT